MLGKKFVQQIVDYVLGSFNDAKFFAPRSYPTDMDMRDSKTKEWLEKLIDKFCARNHALVNKQLCFSEREGFVEQLYAIGDDQSMPKAWEFCTTSGDEWLRIFLEIMKLRQINLLIPASTVECEGIFKTKQDKDD